MIPGYEKPKITPSVDELISSIESEKLNAAEEKKVSKLLEEFGYDVIIHPEKGHTENIPGNICVGSDSNSNCHAGCVNGDMCAGGRSYWVVDKKRRIEVLKSNI